MKFLVEETRPGNDSFLATNFADALKERLSARRDTLFATLVLYLSKRESLSPNYPMQLSTKTAATKFGIELMSRLFKGEDGGINNEELAAPAALSLHERLQLSVGSVQPEPGTQKSGHVEQDNSKFSAEFKYY